MKGCPPRSLEIFSAAGALTGGFVSSSRISAGEGTGGTNDSRLSPTETFVAIQTVTRGGKELNATRRTYCGLGSSSGLHWRDIAEKMRCGI